MKLDLTGEEITKEIRKLTNEENKKEKILYGDIEKAIRSLNDNLSTHYEFKYNSQSTRGNNTRIMIPFEISNLFASFVSLKRLFKTFDLVSRRDCNLYQYNGTKHPQEVNDDNINAIDLEEVTKFTACVLEHIKNFSDIEKLVFSQYLFEEGVIRVFDKYDNIIMLERQFIYFIQTIYRNYSSNFENHIEALRLQIQNYTELVQYDSKKEFNNEENKFFLDIFSNIYMRTYDCYAKSINHILSVTHSKDGERKPIEEFINEKDIVNYGMSINSLNDVKLGKSLTEKRISNLKADLNKFYSDTIRVKLHYAEFKKQRNVFYNSEELFKILEDNIYDLMETEIDCLIDEEISISDKFKKRNKAIRRVYCMGDIYGISGEIDMILDNFYLSLEHGDISNKFDFLSEQDDILREKISDLKNRFDKNMKQYKQNLSESVTDYVAKSFDQGIAPILSELSKREKDNKPRPIIFNIDD